MSFPSRFFFIVGFGLALFGCSLPDFGDDMPPVRSYCEQNQCKEWTEVRHRPTSFAVELQLNDSSDCREAKLFTIDCAYLPDEDSSEYSTFCVDSLKFGDSLRYLPQKNKRSLEAYNSITVRLDGYALSSFLRVPIDSDNHLRFTLVDREKVEKKYDLDLSDYIGMYKAHGDTFDFKFPPNTVFTSFSRGSVVGTGVDGSHGLELDCYDYSRDSVFSVSKRFCVLSQERYADGWEVTEMAPDTGYCQSQRFFEKTEEAKVSSFVSISCDKTVLNPAPETLTVSNLYSLSLMTDAIRNLLPVNVNVGRVNGHRHAWHTVSKLNAQDFDGENDFTIYVTYRD